MDDHQSYNILMSLLDTARLRNDASSIPIFLLALDIAAEAPEWAMALRRGVNMDLMGAETPPPQIILKLHEFVAKNPVAIVSNERL